MEPDARREAILDSVIELLRTRGSVVTTREIAEAAGVAEGTLFSVFTDKRELILKAVQRQLDPGPVAAELDAIERNRSLEEKLHLISQVVLPRLDEVWALATALHAMPAPARKKAAGPPAYLEGWTGAVREGIARLLQSHQHELRFPFERAAYLLTGLLASSRPPMAMPANRPSPAELATLFLHGAAVSHGRKDD